MKWTGHKYYAVSDAGYHIAKSGHPPLIIKYTCYDNKGKLMECDSFRSFSEASAACNDHHNKMNRATEEDMF